MRKYYLAWLAIAITFTLVAACEKQEPLAYYSEIYLVRHFEKQSPSATTGKNVNLTKVGERNAILLAEHLQNKQIKTIYSTNFNRTKQSAEPTSQLFGVPVSIYDPQSLEPFAQQLLGVKHNQLVVGHSNTAGVLFGLLGCENIPLAENDYGDIFVIKRSHTQTGATISACVSYKIAQNTYDISQLKLVNQGDLRKYWVQSNAKFSFNSLFANKPALNLHHNIAAYPKQDGIVEVGFIIDVHGKTSNYEILQSQPSSLWEAHAIEAVKQLKFALVESQKETVKPIYTTWIFTFKAP